MHLYGKIKLQPLDNLKNLHRSLILLSVLIWIELFGVTFAVIVYLIYKNLLEIYLDSMNISNVIHIDYTFLILIITSLIIYAYFFGILSENYPRGFEYEERKKYFWVFENLTMIAIFFTLLFFIYLFIGVNYLKMIDPIDFAESTLFIVIAWINVTIASSFQEKFDNFSSNYKNLESFCNFAKTDNEKEGELKGKEFFKKQLIKLKNYPRNVMLDCHITSTFIFILTLEFAFIGFITNFNILLTIFVISTFLLIHMWISKTTQLPTEKNNIHLISGEILNHVFIIHEVSNSSIVVLSEENVHKKIPMSSVTQIVKSNPN